MRSVRIGCVAMVAALAVGLSGCGGTPDGGGAEARSAGAGGAAGREGRPSGGSGGGHGGGGMGARTAVPVEVAAVVRRPVSSFLETNGTLEAENEVDIVARTTGPIVELNVEEGMRVEKGQVLAKLDERELRADLEIARVALAEAHRAHERAKASREADLISEEVYDQALARFESAQAQLTRSEVLLAYTSITAPFESVIVERHVKLAESVSPNQQLFRISAFDPLLCPIQVPEKELPRLRVRQPGYLTVEAWPGERFDARVLRISPVIDATSGTVKVTLQVSARGKLRPGMFASVFLTTDTHAEALVIPRVALALDSLGDSVFVVDGQTAQRRDVSLGYEEADVVEVLSGLSPDDRVVVVGQDGLSDGTPVEVLDAPGAGRSRPGEEAAPTVAARERGAPAAGRRPEAQPMSGRPAGTGQGGRGAGGRPAFADMTPERLEQIKERMRQRGMSEEEIEERIRQRRAAPQPPS